MRPYKYSVVGEEIVFHYKFSELREFIELGKKEGNVGVILSKYLPNGFVCYKGFGTYENPCKEFVSWTLKHNDLFDGGKLETPDEVINFKPSESYTSYRFTILNIEK